MTAEMITSISSENVKKKVSLRMYFWGITLPLILAGFNRASYNEIAFPPMGSEIELLFTYGRPLAIAMLLAVIVLRALSITKATRTLKYTGGAAWLLMLLNCYLSIKIAYYGEVTFAIGALALIILQFSVLSITTHQLFNVKNELQHTTRPTIDVVMIMVVAGIAITCINLYCLYLYPESVINNSKRLHGTTANPQHLAMSLSLTTPFFLTIFLRSSSSILAKIPLIALTVSSIYLLLKTDSRTGAACFIIMSLLIISLNTQKARISTKIIFLSITGFLLTIFSREISMQASVFFVDRGNTRLDNWELALDLFDENLLFGAPPLLGGGRLLFVESAWLALLSAGGIVAGLFALVLIGYTVKFIFTSFARIRQLSNEQKDMLVLTIGVLVASVFEAIFLGIFVTHTMICYIALGAIGSKRMKFSTKL